jgi:peptidoglycan hydrolase CwlO-like protein
MRLSTPLRLILVTLMLFIGSFNHSQAADCGSFACAAIEDDDKRLTCVDEKVACYQKELEANKNRQQDLKSELTYIDNRIAYQEAQIEKTRLEIIRAGKEIDVLSNRIDNLSDSMERLATLLTTLALSSYKAQHLSSLEMFLQADNFAQAIKTREGEELASLQTSKILFKSMQEKLDFNQKKEERENLQEELEAKTQQLKKQQVDLEKQKEERAILLEQTKNDEKEYQRLIEEARKEADAFRRFAASAGGSSCLSSSPGQGDNGWFYSQRDPKWCKQYIGGSNMTIGEVGCYITAVVMVHKKYGGSMTPSSFATNRNYFFSNTALMTTPPAPGGKTYRRFDYFNKETIDKELREERPVIVHVRTNNGYGGHFVVLLSGENGNYKMHDPWYGPDIDFTKHYHSSMIDSVRVFN